MADLTSAQRNALNVQLRQQPWYQAWFRAKGLNPNQVKLTDAQRKELAQVASANGMPIPDHTLIDQAGNVNIQHGFAGLPTWAKIAIGAGAAAAGGVGLAAALPSAGGAALGAGEASTTLGATGGVVPGLAASAAPAAVAGAPGALGASILANGAGSGSIWGKLAPSLLNIGANAVGGYFQSRAAGKAADQQSAVADKALGLQRDMWNTTQQNQAPYMQAGSQAVTRLNDLMGGSPLQSQSQSLANLQPQAQPQMVNMKAPDGSVRPVPQSEVQHWTQRGAVAI